MRRLLAAAALGLVTAQASGAQSLGRFFFTPAERAQLDAGRVTKQKPAAAPVAETPRVAPPVPQTVTYGGIVRRSDGKSMLWINNRLVDEKEALTGLNLRGRVRPDGAVTLQVPESDATVDVKVGQSVQVHTGHVAERRQVVDGTAEPGPVEARPSTVGGSPDASSDKTAPAPAPANAGAAIREAEAVQEQALRHRDDPKEPRSGAARR